MEYEIKEKQSSIDSYQDDELFVMMSFRETDKEEADRAYAIFYKRYAKKIWSICYKVCGNQLLYGEDLAEYVFSETMIRIYKYPTYDGSCKVSTWASKIAHNIMISFLDKPQEESYYDNIATINGYEQEDNFQIIISQTIEQKILDDALNSLSEKEKHILLTYFEYKDQNKHLPDSVMSELKKTYATTSDNIRQIRKRAFDKVKQCVSVKMAIVELKNK